MDHLTITTSIIHFLRSISIEVREKRLWRKTILPGIKIDHGALIVDRRKLAYPGDLLHEAGHLAVAPPSRRSLLHVTTGNDAAEEMMALAWSYAAAVHLRLDPAIVFHSGGYKGQSDALMKSFMQGTGVGVPTLQWIGLTAYGDRAKELAIEPFPHMIRWLREIETP